MHNDTVKSPTLFKSLQQALLAKLLQKRHLKNTITLKHQTIYVLPSHLGVYFTLVAILNFVMGINYQNNLILMMAYLMFVLIIVAVLIGYSNAKGLTVTFKKSVASFAPHSPVAQFELQSSSRCQSVLLVYQGKQHTQLHRDQINNKPIMVNLSLPYKSRGCFTLQRIKIVSNYPFGLVNVWSYLQPQAEVYVYPSFEQVPCDAHITTLHEQVENGVAKKSGSEEFTTLTPHLPEMGLQKISWKHFAKTQQLFAKEFVDFRASDTVFDFNLMHGQPEQRLSQLCFLICQATDQNNPFMLKLPHTVVKTNSGQQHKKQCLELLSSFKGAV
jgi:uncharacterized protein (DUF58 family)